MDKGARVDEVALPFFSVLKVPSSQFSIPIIQEEDLYRKYVSVRDIIQLELDHSLENNFKNIRNLFWLKKLFEFFSVLYFIF